MYPSNLLSPCPSLNLYIRIDVIFTLQIILTIESFMVLSFHVYQLMINCMMYHDFRSNARGITSSLKKKRQPGSGTSMGKRAKRERDRRRRLAPSPFDPTPPPFAPNPPPRPGSPSESFGESPRLHPPLLSQSECHPYVSVENKK
jgi:hypothetical protein